MVRVRESGGRCKPFSVASAPEMGKRSPVSGPSRRRDVCHRNRATGQAGKGMDRGSRMMSPGCQTSVATRPPSWFLIGLGHDRPTLVQDMQEDIITNINGRDALPIEGYLQRVNGGHIVTQKTDAITEGGRKSFFQDRPRSRRARPSRRHRHPAGR